MKSVHAIEAAITKHLLLTILLIVVLTSGTFAIILILKVSSVSALSSFVDAVFKVVAVIVAAIWTLNRYYVGRVDVSQLRVDAEVSVISASEFEGNSLGLSLLIYRIEVVNTGKSLIPRSSQFLEIESVIPTITGSVYEPIFRWPSDGLHPAGPIEPASWAAINNSIPIPKQVKAIRLFLEVHLPDDNLWTWHKTFDISRGVRDGNVPAK